MKDIKKIVEEAVFNNITDDDIECAVSNIIEEIDFEEYLSESEALKDAVYSCTAKAIDSFLEAYL